jgi:serine/threonine protein kinase/predicted Zn-dependent protease
MGLSASQMAQMSRLLDEALPLDAAARRSWLERLAAEYRDIAPALWEALLPGESRVAAPRALETLPKLPAARASGGSARSLQAGARVGPYELIRALGAGGMAEVWLARRADGAMKRTVALKIPTLMLVRSELEQRFARERDILASLEHPHIARLYDAGIGPDSQPYLAMEYVEGQPLTDWCDAHRLPTTARLELCLQVLEAMQYAHDKHVVHRDLKPSNILVTDTGQVRLLDFGVAKLLEEDAVQVQLTSVYGRALTPDYASPELLRGERLDARCDIYSFGVVLYELLVGVRPYQLKSAGSVGLLEQAIASVEVEKPSARAEPQAAALRASTLEGLARQLRGDLDAITVKTLAKEPAERYPSAADLAKDLRSYLERRPVAARPARFAYRLRKFVRRNRTIVVVSSAAVAAILTAFGYVAYRGTVTQAIGSNSVTVSTAAVAEKSIAVLPFVDMSEKRDQEYFSDGLSEELINHLAHSPDLKVIARTSSFQFKGKNEDARSIARKLGVDHLLEGSVRKADRALRVTVQLIRASDGAQLWSQAYDRNLVDIFKVQDEIAGEVAQALHITFANSGETRSRQPDLEAYNLVLEGNYFQARWTQRDVERAIQLYSRAIHVSPDYALAWARLAGAYFDQEALTGRASADDNRRILDALDQAIRLDPKLALAYFTRAGFELTVSWDWKAAAANVERVREIEPGNDLLPRALGGLVWTFGQVDRAVELYEKALERDPLDARILAYVGDALCAANRTGECLQSRLRLLQLHPDFGGAYSMLGTSQLQGGQFAEALGSMQKEPEEKYRLAGLAMAYSALGRRADSDGAVQSLEDKFASTDAYAIAEAHAFRGDIDLAFKWLDRAYSQRDPEIVSVMADPLLRNLHGDKRFQALLVKLRLASEKPFSTNEGRS